MCVCLLVPPTRPSDLPPFHILHYLPCHLYVELIVQCHVARYFCGEGGWVGWHGVGETKDFPPTTSGPGISPWPSGVLTPQVPVSCDTVIGVSVDPNQRGL